MKRLALIIVIALVATSALLLGRNVDVPQMPKGVPVAALAARKPLPQIGLVAPLPQWMPLPDRGIVLGAGLYPPQPPFGPAASMMIRLEESQGEFAAAYEKRLIDAGFAMRRIPSPPNLIIDAPDACYEADERMGGRTIYITLRAKHYVQLTFWDVPAPRS